VVGAKWLYPQSPLGLLKLLKQLGHDPGGPFKLCNQALECGFSGLDAFHAPVLGEHPAGGLEGVHHHEFAHRSTAHSRGPLDEGLMLGFQA